MALPPPAHAAALEAAIAAEAAAHAVNINLAARRIAAVPPSIRLLVDVERLGLNNNLIATLPPDFSRLAALRYLNLRSNALREFPAPLKDLPRLEVLDLSKNKIDRFPANPGRLIHLRVLSVSRNRILSLPKYIASMASLQVLKLDHNPFTWPPTQVLHCESEEKEQEWLRALKIYIDREDPPTAPFHGHGHGSSSLSSSHRRGHAGSSARSGHSSSSSSSVSPLPHPLASSSSSSTHPYRYAPQPQSSPASQQPVDCSRVIAAYFVHSSSAHAAPHAPDTTLAHILSVCKTLLVAAGEIYDISRTLTDHAVARSSTAGGGTGIGAAPATTSASSGSLPPVVVEREMRAINREALVLLAILAKSDRREKSLSAVVSADRVVQPSDASQPQPIGNDDAARIKNDGGASNTNMTLDTLKPIVLRLIKRLGSLVAAVSSTLLPFLYDGPTPPEGRVILTVLCDWHKANVLLSGAVQHVYQSWRGSQGISKTTPGTGSTTYMDALRPHVQYGSWSRVGPMMGTTPMSRRHVRDWSGSSSSASSIRSVSDHETADITSLSQMAFQSNPQRLPRRRLSHAQQSHHHHATQHSLSSVHSHSSSTDNGAVANGVTTTTTTNLNTTTTLAHSRHVSNNISLDHINNSNNQSLSSYTTPQQIQTDLAHLVDMIRAGNRSITPHHRIDTTELITRTRDLEQAIESWTTTMISDTVFFNRVVQAVALVAVSLRSVMETSVGVDVFGSTLIVVQRVLQTVRWSLKSVST